MDNFIKESRLYEIKPDSRYFGFNHPSPGVLENGLYGYEIWVTIPDGMRFPAPLTKKKFEGGLFAATTIRFPEFRIWQNLSDWAQTNDEFEPSYVHAPEEGMDGCLEEHLN